MFFRLVLHALDAVRLALVFFVVRAEFGIAFRFSALATGEDQFGAGAECAQPQLHRLMRHAFRRQGR